MFIFSILFFTNKIIAYKTSDPSLNNAVYKLQTHHKHNKYDVVRHLVLRH